MAEMNHDSVIHQRVLHVLREYSAAGPLSTREVYESYTDEFGPQSTAALTTVLNDLANTGKVKREVVGGTGPTIWSL